MVLGLLSILLIVTLLLVASFLWADHELTCRGRADAVYLFAAGLARDDVPEEISEQQLGSLPAPMQRYLREAGVVGARCLRTARLRQRGRLRTKPGARWLPMTAEQYFATEEPGFVWLARVAGILRGRDRWMRGEGALKISLLSLFTLTDLTGGAELSQGAMLRYLSELFWLPTAWLDPRIQHEAVNEQRVRVSMRYGDDAVQATIDFDAEGLPRTLCADRYREQGGQFVRTPWFVSLESYARMGPFVVPRRGRASWKLTSGDFDYVELEIDSVDFDPHAPYAG